MKTKSHKQINIKETENNCQKCHVLLQYNKKDKDKNENKNQVAIMNCSRAATFSSSNLV